MASLPVAGGDSTAAEFFGLPLADPRTTYVICTNPRSGSWLLSEGLSSTARAGNPREWFNVLEEQRQRVLWGDAIEPSFTNYLRHIKRAATTTNGICGVKLHYYQFVTVTNALRQSRQFRHLTPGAALAAVFNNVRYVWLTRRDKTRQAISYDRASKTGNWWSIDGASACSGPGEDWAFDPANIHRLERILNQNDRKWQEFFQSANVEPLTLFYEELEKDFFGTIRAIMAWLEIPDADRVMVAEPRLRRQADNESAARLKRYLEFKEQHERSCIAEMSAQQTATYL
jgi:LPS sulfotransferase NodH